MIRRSIKATGREVLAFKTHAADIYEQINNYPDVRDKKITGTECCFDNVFSSTLARHRRLCQGSATARRQPLQIRPQAGVRFAR
jgi:hypothetical protein